MIKCLQCRKFDEETKAKMMELFGPAELSLVALNLAAFLKHNGDLVLQSKDLKARMAAVQQRDIISRTIGKFLVSMTTKDREVMLSIIEKRFNMKLNIVSENCPHQPEPKEPA